MATPGTMTPIARISASCSLSLAVLTPTEKVIIEISMDITPVIAGIFPSCNPLDETNINATASKKQISPMTDVHMEATATGFLFS